MEQENEYKVLSHKFCGNEGFEGKVYGYTYEITFNKSLQHTGRFSGIEKGLNDYVRREKINNLKYNFKSLWYSLIYLIKK